MSTPCWNRKSVQASIFSQKASKQKDCGQTEVRTLLRADSSASIRNFSSLRPSKESFDRSGAALPVLGPEGTVGALMLSSMGMPIPRQSVITNHYKEVRGVVVVVVGLGC